MANDTIGSLQNQNKPDPGRQNQILNQNNQDQNKEERDVQFYRQAYEKEKARAASLAGRLADARNEADSLQFQLDRIKNNPLWRA